MTKSRTTTTQNVLRVILGAFMVLAAIGHMTFQRQEFQAQVPGWVPMSKDAVVILSGIAELLLGIGMIAMTKYKEKVGLALAIFYVLIFPGNIAQYVNGIDAFGLNTDTKRLIRLFFQPVLILWALWSTGAMKYYFKGMKQDKYKDKSFFDFEAENLQGKPVSMADYKGKTVMVVNTASKCGLTPQYEGLEELYKKYKDEGLVILGFPCNQFGGQEPGAAGEIEEFCQVNYGVSFPMFSKVDVNGDDAHPIFKYLKSQLGGFAGSRIKWNFTKFLIDKNGHPVERFAPTRKPADIEPAIKKLL